MKNNLVSMLLLLTPLPPYDGHQGPLSLSSEGEAGTPSDRWNVSVKSSPLPFASRTEEDKFWYSLSAGLQTNGASLVGGVPGSPIPLLLSAAKRNRKERDRDLSGRAASRERTRLRGGAHRLRTGSRSGYLGGPRHGRAVERASGRDGEPGVRGLFGARQRASLQSYLGGSHRRGSGRNRLDECYEVGGDSRHESLLDQPL